MVELRIPRQSLDTSNKVLPTLLYLTSERPNPGIHTYNQYTREIDKPILIPHPQNLTIQHHPLSIYISSQISSA